jgi:hypothetical protein
MTMLRSLSLAGVLALGLGLLAACSGTVAQGPDGAGGGSHPGSATGSGSAGDRDASVDSGSGSGSGVANACSGQCVSIADSNYCDVDPDADCPSGTACCVATYGADVGSPTPVATCAAAAAAICNAAPGCGSAAELSLQACEVGEVWVSTQACIAHYTANCGADAAVTPSSPSIADPAACMSALPFECSHGQAVIPASCVACASIAVDAG